VRLSLHFEVGEKFDIYDMIAVIVFLQRTAERNCSEQMWKICLG